MNLYDASAAELARILWGMSASPNPGTAAGSSMIEEALIDWARIDGDIDGPYRHFCESGYAYRDAIHRDTEDPDIAWIRVRARAIDLAMSLEKLGERRIARCKRKTGCGTCNTPLDTTGECPVDGYGADYALKHTD